MREDKMNNESPNQNMKEIWQCQPVVGIKMSVEEIHKRAAKFERKIMWRNVREYVAGAMAAALFVSFLIKSHDVFFQVAFAMMIAGLAYMSYQLHRRTSPRRMPAELGAANSLQFHRSELERQLDFIRHIWRWYLGPLVPGLLAFSLATVVADHHNLVRIVLVNAFFALCLILVWRLNVYAASCLKRRIDELSAVEAATQ
jgi:hypothetical protein